MTALASGQPTPLCASCLQTAIRIHLNIWDPPHPSHVIQMEDGNVGHEGYCETCKPRRVWVERRPGKRLLQCQGCLSPLSGTSAL